MGTELNDKRSLALSKKSLGTNQSPNDEARDATLLSGNNSGTHSRGRVLYPWRRLRFRLMMIPVVALIWLFGMSAMTQKPKSLGLFDGRLYPLPNTPNCVSTEASDEERLMPALKFQGDAAETKSKLLKTIGQFPRWRLVEDDGDYLHVEATSLIFRFIDDVEFLIDRSTHRVHFRSASRIGHSDLGANRKRMQRFTNAFRQPD